MAPEKKTGRALFIGCPSFFFVFFVCFVRRTSRKISEESERLFLFSFWICAKAEVALRKLMIDVVVRFGKELWYPTRTGRRARVLSPEAAFLGRSLPKTSERALSTFLCSRRHACP